MYQPQVIFGQGTSDQKAPLLVLNPLKIGNHLFRTHSHKVSVDLKHIYLFDLKKVIQKEKRRIVQMDQAVGEFCSNLSIKCLNADRFRSV